MTTKQRKKRNHNINHRIAFYVSFSALIMVFLFLVIDLTTAIYFPMPEFVTLTLGERVSNYYSYFTTQSNYMVAFYFALYMYNSYFKRALPSFQVRLAVTVYITITMLVFWSAIFTQFQDPKQYNVYNWFNTIILHFIMPVAMISNFVITCGQNLYDIKKWHHNYLWIIAIYPLGYALIILIRGIIRHADYLISIANNNPIPHPSAETWFPYPFFNIFQPNGWLYATFAFLAVFTLVFSLQYFYIWINNLMHRRKKPYEEQIELYYLKTLEKIGKRKRRRKI